MHPCSRVRSASPSPTAARSASLDTICSGAKWVAAQLDFPEPDGPASTTRHGAGSTTASLDTPKRYRSRCTPRTCVDERAYGAAVHAG